MPAWEVRKPVIAAVNGHAIGIGLTITFHCDIRFFAADAKYGVVQVRRGVMGDAYSHWTLPRIAGMSAAAEVLLTGRMFDGHEAKALGLCSRVLPNDEVLPAALELAHDIAGRSPDAIRFAKRLYDESWTAPAADSLRLESELQVRLMGSPNQIAAVQAAMTKQPGAFVDPE
jgi:enoyl-CoA hydratase/carnithine racemase